MCGIACIVAPKARQFAERLDRMLDALQHRGPDGEGRTTYPECLLGHRRLSIVDLEGGSQPMVSMDRNLAVTFNGEIYGYQALRQSTDYPYQTQSDTELILALYCRHGVGMMRRLPGMFAFALWDERRKSLFCARDRFGEKPLYYARDSLGRLLIASEIKAILASGLIEPELDLASLSHYLQRVFVPSGKTIYKNIQSLPPAHCLLMEEGRLRTWRYWELPMMEPRVTLDEAAEHLRYLLREAVRRQLVADVEVAAFLSGGLDSTTIVALGSSLTSRLRTFSFGFGDSINELPVAGATAHHYGTHHQELLEGEVSLPDLLRHMASVYDEPFADSSNIPTYLLCQLASQHVKVVLTGDGGDELLGGYAYWYRPLIKMQELHKSPWLDILFFLSSVAKLLRVQGFPMSRELSKLYKRVRQGVGIAEAHWHDTCYLSSTEVHRLGLEPSKPPPFSITQETVDAAFRSDILDYMPGDILVKTDRASMAHGLELRAPILDVDVAEFCIALPWTLKISDARDKIVLRRAFDSQWPEAVKTLPKQGFGAPVWAWLQRPDMKDSTAYYLEDSRRKIHSLLDTQRVREVARRADYHTWILLCLSVWLEETAPPRLEGRSH